MLVQYAEAQTDTPAATIATASGVSPISSTTDWSDDRKTLLLSFHLPDQPQWEEITWPSDQLFTKSGIVAWDLATYCMWVPEPATLLALSAAGTLALRRRSE